MAFAGELCEEVLVSKDKANIAKQNDPHVTDAKNTEEAAAESKRLKDEELDEGLDESFPGSDAPASTRRSSKD